MTTSDLQMIESELSIRVPDAYRRNVAPFPIPCLAGNRDTELWDDSVALISYNRQLRDGPSSWPRHLFAVGRNEGDPAVRAIDLRAPDAAPVWWIDHADPRAAGSGQTHSSFEDWVEHYVTALRRDLVKDGCDPDASPAHYAAWRKRGAHRERRVLFCLVVLGLGAIILYGLIRWHI